jgi:hypothetical protein
MNHRTRQSAGNRDAATGTQACACEIVVGVRLGRRWAGAFEGFELVDRGDGTTALRGEACDQAALFGVLNRIRDLGAPLRSVRLLSDRAAATRNGSDAVEPPRTPAGRTPT